MAYIHELPEWPNFTWDAAAVAGPLAAVRHKQGRLIGRMQGLGLALRSEAQVTTLTSDVVRSSAIEGERLEAAEVRSSISRKLGLDAGGAPPAGRAVRGIVEVMVDATQNFAAPLTAERLWGWHHTLFSGEAAPGAPVRAWRRPGSGPMRVVSGPLGSERVHFEAPEPERLEEEMTRFLAWFNGPQREDAVLRAAIAHLWFVTIHPFDDGNGRLARAIADLSLARADGVRERYSSMSTQIEKERREYYLQLERQQKADLNITRWLGWFLGCLDRAIDAADDMLGAVLFKARLWEFINRGPVNHRQRLVVNRLLDDFKGFLNTSKYAKLARCSTDTALRDIRELLDRGVLVQNPGGGRATSYRLIDPDELAGRGGA